MLWGQGIGVHGAKFRLIWAKQRRLVSKLGPPLVLCVIRVSSKTCVIRRKFCTYGGRELPKSQACLGARMGPVESKIFGGLGVEIEAISWKLGPPLMGRFIRV